MKDRRHGGRVSAQSVPSSSTSSGAVSRTWRLRYEVCKYQSETHPYEIINEYRPFGYIIKGGNATILYDMIDGAVAYCKNIRANREVIERLSKVQKDLEALRRRP